MTGSLTQKSGKYYAVINYYTDDCIRKQKWINTGYEVKGNKKKAEQFLRDTLAEYERNKVNIDKDMLFTDFLDEWLLIIKNNVRANTLSSYQYVVDKHIKPYFAGKRLMLSQLKPMHLQKYYAYKMDTGLSANSVLKHHTNIHNALEHALRMNMIPFNPADRVYLPKKKKFVGKFYDENQLNELLNLVKGTPIETAVYLTAFYGLRRSEVLGLKWDAINFQRGTLEIKHTAVSCDHTVLYDDVTKTKASNRTLPLNGSMQAYLLSVKQHQTDMKELFGGEYSDNDYVCKFDDGHLMRPDYLTSKFIKLLEKSELPRIRFHDLRHSSASFLLSNGFSLKELQEWLGHGDVGTTGNIYAHLQFKAKENMAAAVESKLLLGA